MPEDRTPYIAEPALSGITTEGVQRFLTILDSYLADEADLSLAAELAAIPTIVAAALDLPAAERRAELTKLRDAYRLEFPARRR